MLLSIQSNQLQNQKFTAICTTIMSPIGLLYVVQSCPPCYELKSYLVMLYMHVSSRSRRDEDKKISGSPSRPPVCTHHYLHSGSNWLKITSLPEGVGTQDQRGDRRTQIDGVPCSASVCCSPMVELHLFMI